MIFLISTGEVEKSTALNNSNTLQFIVLKNMIFMLKVTVKLYSSKIMFPELKEEILSS